MFKGRLGVKQYWLSVLVITLIQIVLIAVTAGVYFMVVLPALLGSLDPMTAGPAYLMLFVFAPLVVVIPTIPFIPFVLGIQVRRLHDINLSGWWWLAPFLVSTFAPSIFPISSYSESGAGLSPVGIGMTLLLSIGVIVLLSWPGTKGPNAYGEPYVYPSLWAAIRGKKVEVSTAPQA